MPTIELTDREVSLVTFHRMTAEQQAAERSRLRDAARQAALGRLTPERRAIAIQRRADAEAAIAAERERVGKLSRDERDAEHAVRMEKSAAALLARLPKAAVDKARAYLASKEA
jgi:hypothetical protein